jgi:hypothetical protein
MRTIAEACTAARAADSATEPSGSQGCDAPPRHVHTRHSVAKARVPGVAKVRVPGGTDNDPGPSNSIHGYEPANDTGEPISSRPPQAFISALADLVIAELLGAHRR